MEEVKRVYPCTLEIIPLRALGPVARALVEYLFEAGVLPQRAAHRTLLRVDAAVRDPLLDMQAAGQRGLDRRRLAILPHPRAGDGLGPAADDFNARRAGVVPHQLEQGRGVARVQADAAVRGRTAEPRN